jgi:hypothetical protein
MPMTKRPMASNDVPMGRRMNGPEIFMRWYGFSLAGSRGSSVL